MKKLILAALLMTALPFTAQAQDTSYQDMPKGVYTTDHSHTSLIWRVNHIGLSQYTARFTKVDISLNFDPATPENSKVKAVIDPLSVRTDYPNAAEKDFDKVLATGPEWFNAAKFPQITFESTEIERTGDKTARVTGNLTLLGVTKPATLDVVFNGAYAKKPFADVPALGFSARGVIKRSDWGFDTYVPNIGDSVEIIIETELHNSNVSQTPAANN